jgi:hypothetical protein
LWLDCAKTASLFVTAAIGITLRCQTGTRVKTCSHRTDAGASNDAHSVDLHQSGTCGFKLFFDMIYAAYFYEKADQLLRLAKHVPAKGIGTEDLCMELEALANEFMQKAVELDVRSGKERSSLLG